MAQSQISRDPKASARGAVIASAKGDGAVATNGGMPSDYQVCCCERGEGGKRKYERREREKMREGERVCWCVCERGEGRHERERARENDREGEGGRGGEIEREGGGKERESHHCFYPFSDCS